MVESHGSKNSVHISKFDLSIYKCIKTDSHKSLKCHLEKNQSHLFLIVHVITSVIFTYYALQDQTKFSANVKNSKNTSWFYSGTMWLEFYKSFIWLFPSSISPSLSVSPFLPPLPPSFLPTSRWFLAFSS